MEELIAAILLQDVEGNDFLCTNSLNVLLLCFVFGVIMVQ
jgi:hypothetical protein